MSPAQYPWTIVARREVAAKLRDRAFLFATGMMLVVITAALVVQGLLANRAHHVTLATASDARPLVTQVAAAAKAADAKTTVTGLTVADDAAAKAALEDGKADAWLHHSGAGWVLTAKSDPDTGLLAATTVVVRENALAANAAAAGTTVQALTRGSVVTPQALDGSGGVGLLRTVLGFVFAFLFYISALLFGVQLAQSVLEEKQSRIVEIIATSIPLRQLLAGKIVGNTLLAFAQMTLYAGLGLVGLSFTTYGKYVRDVGGPIAWFLVFFVAGFAALACLWAVAGALASRSEDLQATTTPLTTFVMAIFFGALMAKGAAATIVSFIPPVSAIAMPMRLLDGGVPWWQPVLALVLLLGFAGLTIRVGERIYRRSLLQTRGRVGIRQAWTAED